MRSPPPDFLSDDRLTGLWDSLDSMGDTSWARWSRASSHFEPPIETIRTMSEAQAPQRGAGDLSDEALLARYRDLGRTEDFAILVKRYERELFRYLARYLNDPVLADDVFQNTFLQIHLKRGMYEDGRPVRPWLYAIATHQAVDALRKIKRHAAVSLDQPSGTAAEGETDPGALVEVLVSLEQGPLARLEATERRQIVRDAIERLPETLRHTLRLAYYQELKYREIADILEIPVGTVKSRLHAALAKLAEMVKAALNTDATEDSPRSPASNPPRSAVSERGPSAEPAGLDAPLTTETLVASPVALASEHPYLPSPPSSGEAHDPRSPR